MSQEDIIDIGHSAALNNAGIFVLADTINSVSVKPVIEWILYENYVTKIKKKELLLTICSEGGQIPDAFALIDTMNSSMIPIKTVGLGIIASCGLLIFMNGAVGKRILTPNTSILSHQFSWSNDGKEHELFATIKEYELTQQRILNHYKKCTGKSSEIIKEWLLPPQDKWLSSEEALNLNICDAVAEFKNLK